MSARWLLPTALALRLLGSSYVESVAKAKSLTQIIPQTGTEIARALGIKNFNQDDLYHPKQNVQFGSFYFAERLKRNA